MEAVKSLYGCAPRCADSRCAFRMLPILRPRCCSKRPQCVLGTAEARVLERNIAVDVLGGCRTKWDTQQRTTAVPSRSGSVLWNSCSASTLPFRTCENCTFPVCTLSQHNGSDFDLR